MKHQLWLLLFIFFFSFPPASQATLADLTTTQVRSHPVQPGDTWLALRWRYGLAETDLAPYRSISRYREPTIGTMIAFPQRESAQTGQIIRTHLGMLETAVRHNTSPWRILIESGSSHRFTPRAYRPLLIRSGADPLHEPPAGLTSLQLSQVPARPGQALGVRAQGNMAQAFTVFLNKNPFASFHNGSAHLALGGTGAFFGSGAPELAIKVADHPLWVQPWLFVDPAWTFEDLTLTGNAVQIDQQSIQEERERLFKIWSQKSEMPQWQGTFRRPLDSFVSVSSTYGARRSYNGGPYRSYHEGVDFAAYGGTPVLAAAAGTVVVAETLFVRGGAVIVDHGLGIYTGYYHMSNTLVAPGDKISQGQIVGEVGSTGLSTGNHLHWDLLVNATWVDADAWLAQEMGGWILETLGGPATNSHSP